MTEDTNVRVCPACAKLDCACTEDEWDTFLWKRENGIEAADTLYTCPDITTKFPFMFIGDDVLVSSHSLNDDQFHRLLACGRPGKDATYCVQEFIVNYRDLIVYDHYYGRQLLDNFGAFDKDQLDDPRQCLELLIWLTGCQMLEQYDNLPDSDEFQAFFCNY